MDENWSEKSQDELARRRQRKQHHGEQAGSRDSYRSGEAVCLSCEHCWEAKGVPVNEVWIDCPMCLRKYGKFKAPAYREGPHWQCGNCNSNLWKLHVDGLYCADCGDWSKRPPIPLIPTSMEEG